jgi:hypothetical protein
MTQRARSIDLKGVVALKGVYRHVRRDLHPGFIMVLENPSRPDPGSVSHDDGSKLTPVILWW